MMLLLLFVAINFIIQALSSLILVLSSPLVPPVSAAITGVEFHAFPSQWIAGTTDVATANRQGCRCALCTAAVHSAPAVCHALLCQTLNPISNPHNDLMGSSCYPHFTCEEARAQGGSVTPPFSSSSRWQSWDPTSHKFFKYTRTDSQGRDWFTQ